MTETYAIEITTVAEQDIEEIWEYIATNNPDDATLFILNLEELVVTLESFPFSVSCCS